ncbi:hypothetical protein KOL96_04360 (plasmid) [Ralstonia wenshanensis]|uniref:hypothetical protein n=1 Tax=Ralstonia wenshanensis TaxID=2842456 RepID=UPI001E53A95E|nr:hypothetical protein [Ralstonia wenshanensis]UGS88020.1 hypothetical protein KOL96_04360 [Ralstonia wenshanensis]
MKSGQEAPGGYKLPGAFFLWMAQLQRSGLQHHVDHAKNVRPLSAYCRSNRGEPSFEKNTNQYFRIALVPSKKTSINLTRHSCAQSDGSLAMVVGIRSDHVYMEHQLYLKVLMFVMLAYFVSN